MIGCFFDGRKQSQNDRKVPAVIIYNCIAMNIKMPLINAPFISMPMGKTDIDKAM